MGVFSPPYYDFQEVTISRPHNSFTNIQSCLICLGALITVVALAIDPFSQQVVQYHDCLEAVGDAAVILPTATNYTRYGTSTSAKDRTLDQQMVNAVYTGLIDPPLNASSSITYDCPTGNCTFIEADGVTHKSLAMCGRCEDLTNTILENYTNATGGPVFPDDEAAIYHILPSTLDSWSDTNATIKMSVGDNWTVVQTWLSTNSYLPSYSEWYISAFDTLMYRNCSCDGGVIYGEGVCNCDVFGANCAIYPCVKSYKANVHNFVLNETEVAREPLIARNISVDFSYKIDSAIRDGASYQCTPREYPSSDAPIPYYKNTSYDSYSNTYDSTQQLEYYPEGCVFEFGWSTTWAARLYLAHNMWGGSLVRSTTNRPYAAVGNPWLTAMFNNGSATLETLNAYIDGLANTMTAVIRKYGDAPSATRVHGTAYAVRTCVRVRWPWLSLPGALLVLAALFLLFTIFNTAKRHELGWKSSPVALLFHGLEADMAAKYSAIVRPHEMNAAARSISVRMERQQAGWHFSAT